LIIEMYTVRIPALLLLRINVLAIWLTHAAGAGSQRGQQR